MVNDIVYNGHVWQWSIIHVADETETCVYCLGDKFNLFYTLLTWHWHEASKGLG